MEKYCRQNLEQLGIYELRAKARLIGVKSPTTKRHNELVDCILKIQNGEEQAFSTKKGRPPKTVNFATGALDLEQIEGAPAKYAYAVESSNPYCLCDDSYVEPVNKELYVCQGILREVDGKKYIYDYLHSRHFVFVEPERLNGINIKIGDFVRGKAFEINQRAAVLNSVIDINFETVATFSGSNAKKTSIQTFVDSKSVYNVITEQDDKSIKIVLELEADDYSIVNMRNKSVFIYSGEYDDIRRAYNASMDCLNLVKRLAENDKPFSLYLMDIDYIYTLINAYMINDGKRPEIDAGQFIRELLVGVKNAVGGNIVIYEKNNYKRSAYLDAILNKYL